jgi:uncharacterized protein
MNAEMAVHPLTAKDRFRFACHKGLSCFTACCANLQLLLTPYDILRLKTRLGLSSEEFLQKYTKTEMDKSHGFPVVYLKMNSDEKKACPFVTPDGCTVYEDRPGACRSYPLGRAASKVRKKEKSEDFFFIIREPHCLGFNEPTEWVIEDWITNQGLNEYNRKNDFYMDIVTGRNIAKIKRLSSSQMKMFYMSCYNLDEFKKFVFQSSLMNRFDINPDEAGRIRTDEVELMKFGTKWLNFALFGEPFLALKPEKKT